MSAKLVATAEALRRHAEEEAKDTAKAKKRKTPSEKKPKSKPAKPKPAGSDAKEFVKKARAFMELCDAFNAHRPKPAFSTYDAKAIVALYEAYPQQFM
jgi:hypothetical protein